MMDSSVTERERTVYREELAPWLPERVLDFHVHVSLPEHTGPIAPERIAANWAMEVGTAQSWADLRATYAALFPERVVECVAFGSVYNETDCEANNNYVLRGASLPENRATALLTTRPEWPAELVGRKLAEGYAGLKPYPDMASAEAGEVGIFAFLPYGHLRVLDDAGGILMLHLPRAGRIADPDNQREVLEIRQRYPRIRLVVAHIGRAYCLPTAQAGLPALAGDADIYFDTAANLNSDVFRYALDTVGPERLLFGTDLPITLMRGMREHVGDQYINYTSEPYSWNTRRKSPEEEGRYTFFLYEELRALIIAMREAGLDSRAIARILYANGAELLRR